jgi:hypothetical protein
MKYANVTNKMCIYKIIHFKLIIMLANFYKKNNPYSQLHPKLNGNHFTSRLYNMYDT